MANSNNEKPFFTSPPTHQIIMGQGQIPLSSVQIPANQITVGPEPARVRCPTCLSEIQTTRRYETNVMTHIAALLLCGVCCCCIPYCIDSCRNVNHYCPKCNTFLGTYK